MCSPPHCSPHCPLLQARWLSLADAPPFLSRQDSDGASGQLATKGTMIVSCPTSSLHPNRPAPTPGCNSALAYSPLSCPYSPKETVKFGRTGQNQGPGQAPCLSGLSSLFFIWWWHFSGLLTRLLCGLSPSQVEVEGSSRCPRELMLSPSSGWWEGLREAMAGQVGVPGHAALVPVVAEQGPGGWVQAHPEAGSD